MKPLYDSYDICAQIRQDWAEEVRLDMGRKGKQCPGGYWIPANKQCGKGGKGGKGGKMKSPGGGKLARNLAIGAAGLAVAGGGGAALAYKNRDKIVAGVDKAGKAVRDKIREEKSKAYSHEKFKEMAPEAQQAMKRSVASTEQEIAHATRNVSRKTRKAVQKAEKFVGGVKQKFAGAKAAVGGAFDKAKQSFSNVVTSGGKDKK